MRWLANRGVSSGISGIRRRIGGGTGIIATSTVDRKHCNAMGNLSYQAHQASASTMVGSSSREELREETREHKGKGTFSQEGEK